MGIRYQHIAFGDGALERQRKAGSIVAYGAGLQTPDSGPQPLGPRELGMITTSFQFHLATVTPSGWPYVQYRSGPPGFMHHLGGNSLGFADFAGNQQFVSVGNLEADARVALFFADFPLKRRIKVYGRARVIEPEADPDLFSTLMTVPEGRIAARGERSIVIAVEAFDWNCSRSLVLQYTLEEVRERIAPYSEENRQLKEEVLRLRRQVAQLQDHPGEA